MNVVGSRRSSRGSVVVLGVDCVVGMVISLISKGCWVVDGSSG